MDRGLQDESRTYAPRIRLFVQGDLAAGRQVALGPEQAHYLLNVMRQKAGDRVGIFNGVDGEWIAAVRPLDRRHCALEIERQERLQQSSPDLWLLFAPVKRARIDFIAQKATEMGVSVLQPVITRRTIVTRVPAERLEANAIEAAEQSWRLDVPEVRPAAALDSVLAAWPSERRLVFCDETGQGLPIAQALEGAEPGPSAVLIGPEGGFDAGEQRAIRDISNAFPVSLGPRILRSDTAAVAALAVWQAVIGDWRG